MDSETIDQNFRQLQKESEDTIDALKTLAQKLQAAVDAGDQNAREWILDLKQIALSVQEEENQATLLLQSIHEFVVNEMQAQPAPAQGAQQPAAPAQPVQYQQPPVQYQEPPQYPPGGMGMGGMLGGLGMGGMGGMGGGLGRFVNSGFGRAMVSGAGFGIGADIIGHIFR